MGFAMGSQFWGTGIFVEAARLVLDFAFEVIGSERLEARAAVANGRGKWRAAQDWRGAGRPAARSFLRNGQHHDQVLWGILADDWRLQRLAQEPAATH
jgi:RimJ/RimL family protein N-acetyltransferase